MAKARKDNKGRVLLRGESQRSQDMRYVYTYTDPFGKRKYLYATDLMELRQKEEKLKRDQLDGLDVYVAGKATINFVFDRYISTKYDLRNTTRANYEYTYDHFVRDGFVFKNRFGNVINQQSINDAIKRIVSTYNAEEIIKAKKEHRKPLLIPMFSCHFTRHTFCSRLCETESNVKVIQSMMGHKDIRTTMDTYAEVTEARKREAIDKLSQNMDIF